jgi:hypothetical protein
MSARINDVEKRIDKETGSVIYIRKGNDEEIDYYYSDLRDLLTLKICRFHELFELMVDRCTLRGEDALAADESAYIGIDLAKSISDQIDDWMDIVSEHVGDITFVLSKRHQPTVMLKDQIIDVIVEKKQRPSVVKMEVAHAL